jgi:NADH:ubiquinone oxidoreductase subunit 4 (subunit M)
MMILLSAVVTFAAIWFTGEIAQRANVFYTCLFFIVPVQWGIRFARSNFLLRIS